jgi:hypothetical protein
VLLFCAVSIMTVLSASALMMFIGSLAKNFEQSNQLVR